MGDLECTHIPADTGSNSQVGDMEAITTRDRRGRLCANIDGTNVIERTTRCRDNHFTIWTTIDKNPRHTVFIRDGDMMPLVIGDLFSGVKTVGIGIPEHQFFVTDTQHPYAGALSVLRGYGKRRGGL